MVLFGWCSYSVSVNRFSMVSVRFMVWGSLVWVCICYS